MCGFTYTIRAETETSDELEKKIINYAREEGVRVPRARRQLVEKGLALVETKLPNMTRREEKTFGERIKRLYSSVMSKKQTKGGEK